MPNSAIETSRKAASIESSDGTQQLTWTGSYFVWSALSGYTGNTPYGLNVKDAVAAAGASIILWPWTGGQPNELWQYTNNQFVSNLSSRSSSLVIGLGDPVSWSPGNYCLALVKQNQRDLTQIWNVDATTGLITNAQYPDLYMNVSGGELAQGAYIMTYSLQAGNADEIWTLMPAWPAPPAGTQPQPAWCFIQSGLSPYENEQITPYVLTVQGPDPAPGNNVILAGPSTDNAASQLWQLTRDRRLLSQVGTATVLTLGSNSVNGVWEVTAAAQQNPTTNSQHWDLGVEAPNQIDNWHVSEFLVVTGGESGPVSPYGEPLVVVAPRGTPNPSYFWYLTPSSPLDAILAHGPVPFPAFTGDQLTAYQYMNQMVGLGQGDTPDLRGQYLNVGATLGQWINTIQGYQSSSGASESDWTAVFNQLNAEVTSVLAVQAVFTNYTTWYNSQFADDATILNGLITDAQIEQGTDTTGVALAVAQGALYTVLEAIPDVGGVLGNIVNTAINAALAAHTISPNPFQLAVSQLWNQLNSTFQAILGQSALMETAILSDWSKLQAVYPLTMLAAGVPGSLSATALGDSKLLAASTAGYKVSAMQILLPAQYQIFQIRNQNDSAFPNVPQKAQWVQKIGNGLWNKYWIATPGDWDAYPSDDAMDDVWNSGVAYSDFFQGFAGWGFARSYPSGIHNTGGSLIGVDCHAIVITITNLTPNLLTATAASDNGQGIVMFGSSHTLLPYGSVSFVGQYDGGLAIDIVISDPNLGGGSHVASFTAHQHRCSTAAGDIKIDPPQSSLGYQLTTPICYRGSYIEQFPGAVQIGICFNPSSSN